MIQGFGSEDWGLEIGVLGLGITVEASGVEQDGHVEFSQ